MPRDRGAGAHRQGKARTRETHPHTHTHSHRTQRQAQRKRPDTGEHLDGDLTLKHRGKKKKGRHTHCRGRRGMPERTRQAADTPTADTPTSKGVGDTGGHPDTRGDKLGATQRRPGSLSPTHPHTYTATGITFTRTTPRRSAPAPESTRPSPGPASQCPTNSKRHQPDSLCVSLRKKNGARRAASPHRITLSLRTAVDYTSQKCARHRGLQPASPQSGRCSLDRNRSWSHRAPGP